MTAQIVHQRTGQVVAVFPTYLAAATRDVLRPQLAATCECPYAIRTEENQ